LSHHAVTIAEVLKSSGYSSYVSGKWHVTGKTAPANVSAKHNWPLQRGFERFYGTIHGAGSFFDPNTLTRDNQSISPFADSDYQPPEYYYTDAIGDHASKFITDHAKSKPDNPFFLYVAFTAAHWPMHAKEADIAKYKGRYDQGYDAIRSARLKKMEELGLLDSRWQISRQAGNWDQVKNKEWEARCMEVFAAMLDSMDQSIGRLVNTLKQNDQYENTLILYLQDNGGCAETLGRNGNFQPKADGPTLPRMANDALQSSMIPKQTRDGFPVRQGAGVMPGAADTFISYGQGWANVSNTPFREYKHWQHEGGISSPLIAHWPKGISHDRKGKLESRPSHLIDLMATCVDVTGATYPTDFEAHTIEPMQGSSFASSFTNQDSVRSHPIFWEHEGNRAVRVGNWKLVSKHSGDWELYEMVSDRTEMTNLASEQPHRVAEMSSLWNEWAQRVGVLPWPLK
jgi:arylsulfatase